MLASEISKYKQLSGFTWLYSTESTQSVDGLPGEKDFIRR